MGKRHPKGSNTAARIAKNSAAMFLVAMFTKGAGLVVAALVARYLGPSALGAHAVVMGLALLFETLAPLGQPYVVIRAVSRERSRTFTYWVNASLVTAASSTALALVLVLLVQLLRYDVAALSSVYAVSLFLPMAGLYLIAQAVLQGLEKMEYLTVSAFVGRAVGLLVLWILLESGMGVVGAFIGRGVFQLTALFILAWAISRQRAWPEIPREWRPDLGLCRATLKASYSFAIQSFLTEALTRVNTVILPMLVTMETVGMFGAADRIRQASAMVIPMVTMAILPTLSRTFVTDRGYSVALMEKALKLLLSLILPFVFVLTIMADEIIPLLYGPGYGAAVPVLQIVIWSQVFFVADLILNQIMMASDNERPMVRRTALSVAASILFTLLLAPRFGAAGVAWAVVLTRALNLGLDAQFVTGNVFRINLKETVGRPFLCAALSAIIAVVLRNQGLYLLLLFSIGSYVVFLLVFGVFSHAELLWLRQWAGRWKNERLSGEQQVRGLKKLRFPRSNRVPEEAGRPFGIKD
jgi:O-antigen/teichoic acid export membrane protein